MTILKGIGLLLVGLPAMLILEAVLVVYCLCGMIFDRSKE